MILSWYWLDDFEVACRRGQVDPRQAEDLLRAYRDLLEYRRDALNAADYWHRRYEEWRWLGRGPW